MNYGMMRMNLTNRKTSLEATLRASKDTIASCEKELSVQNKILDALKGLGGKPGRGAAKVSPVAKSGKKGKWKPGSRGRKPQWYLDQMAGVKPAKAPKTGKKKRGQWKEGHPGRPPQWFIDQKKAGGKGGGKTGKKPAKAKKAAKVKKVTKTKRVASPKMLAALAKAREVMAAKRAAAKAATPSAPL